MKLKLGMRRFFQVVLMCALVPAAVRGATFWGEVEDAGELTGMAQPVIGAFELGGIVGSLSFPTDRDIYQIYISNPSTFQITVTVAENPLNQDTILAIFNSSGIGMIYNDNISDTNWKSELTGAALDGAGNYYLAIMGGGQTFTSDDGNIWNEATPFTGQKTPDGGGRLGALTGYAVTGTGPAVGTYVITMSGVTPVPEPSNYGIAFAVMGLTVAGIRHWKSGRRSTS